jgi:undecaprenyl-diphosphatase
MTVLLYGHRKLGSVMMILAIVTAISRIAIGVHYPSDIIGGTIVGLISGILAYWWMESFEYFWHENSIKD